MNDTGLDYVVVGSGAGGGPLAANLAKAGFKVLLLEAGGDPCSESETGRLMYEVPIFYGDATEYKPCAWDFFVRRYSDDQQQAKDSKTVRIDGRDMLWYPRAGVLGGCTAHNALILVLPQDSDWNYVAQVTGDDSWKADKMRDYFAQLENCTYVARPGSLKYEVEGLWSSVSEFLKGHEDWRDWRHGHGFSGWLTTSEADPRLVLRDPQIIKLLLNGVIEILRDHIGSPAVRLETLFDPNDSRNAQFSPEGLAFTPLSMANGRRNGPREYILSTKSLFPGNLTVKLNALATRVLFEDKRAVGIEYIDQAHMYRADPQAIADPASLPHSEVRVKREVILAGGAFNTPQLLMLSGVGPRAELDKFKIPVVVDLPGVGENLQDRYEVGVISELARDFTLLQGGTFAPPEPGESPDVFLRQWEESGTGIYATNGSLVGIILRSKKELPDPDLYIFSLPGVFKGYYPGYSKNFERYHNRFTWAVLKARTQNTGRVQLASANPWDTPWINFHNFGDGKRQNDPDLEAMLTGVKFVRAMNERLKTIGVVKEEEIPGMDKYRTDDELRGFIQAEAWGHHASCTCKIGADSDPMAVLDSRFRVRKTKGLRVVDASVFPKIPGYLIVSAVYMISEKAADAVIEDASLVSSIATAGR